MEPVSLFIRPGFAKAKCGIAPGARVGLTLRGVEAPDDLTVFVYGTLMPGAAAWAERCAGRVEAKRRARVRGQLFVLPEGYPALLPEAGPEACWIAGWLLRLRDHATLRGFDEWEDFQPGRAAADNEYQRVRIPVYAPAGRAARPRRLGWAWTYAMHPTRLAARGAAVVPGGRWRAAGRIRRQASP